MSALFEHDRDLCLSCGLIVGVDEAGRGPLAGPVVAAAVCFTQGFYDDDATAKACGMITDSKQLPEEVRETVFELLHRWRDKGRVHFAVAASTVAEIDALNILGATRLAMQRALEALPHELPRTEAASMPLFHGQANGHGLHILVDGKPLKPFPYAHQSLVKGDGHSLSIAAASILAKVTRDREMAALDREFPGYGLARHKGYGTAMHRQAIREKGPLPCHRRLFLRKILR